ncbi:hypothetical protein FJTKL_05656 [Diaporthe vaccinii]|uniref:Uncharacterized protein n=1 Tax=Diaporthe vaccinii TaxID=105482 RepID=A0ABR4DRF7_9PEZI
MSSPAKLPSLAPKTGPRSFRPSPEQKGPAYAIANTDHPSYHFTHGLPRKFSGLEQRQKKEMNKSKELPPSPVSRGPVHTFLLLLVRTVASNNYPVKPVLPVRLPLPEPIPRDSRVLATKKLD